MTTKLEQAAREVVRQHSMECLSDKAVDSLREALAEQAEQEPVAWALSHSLGVEFSSKYPMQTTKEAAEQMAREHMGNVVVTPLYAAPVQQAEQEPFKMICPRCKVDRVTTQCPNRGGIGDCPMTATAQSAAPVQQAEQEPFDMNDHPPHRLCECRKCMEYFTPLPDCDAFAASGNKVSDHTAGGGKVINADRELLELAAKAAGYEVYWHHANQCYMIVEGSSERKWKPLSNGHDSLQLAAKFLMSVWINKAAVIVCSPQLESGFTPPPVFEYPISDYDEDFNINYRRHYEATCLAILRAAAEIGKELP